MKDLRTMMWSAWN